IIGNPSLNHRYRKGFYSLFKTLQQNRTPYDNAGIESFHASLKKEEVYTTSYSDFEEANRALFSYIEGFYNRNRIHSSIHYLTPQEFEELAKEKMA
ncbi:IS3 family transposase, partial [Enterococcus faecium]|uniref:IS3 family transposase n=1 Tax=Enterococcus faecium TaxID=1352 RepID=UPI00288D9EE6